MEKVAMDAFNKLQKREHVLRVIRDRKALGKISLAQFKEESQAVVEKYALTQDEERAYEYQVKIVAQRKHG